MQVGGTSAPPNLLQAVTLAKGESKEQNMNLVTDSWTKAVETTLSCDT